MSHLETETFEAAQAALLNSECDPREAVAQALRASALFAREELSLNFETWVRACQEAWDNLPKD